MTPAPPFQEHCVLQEEFIHAHARCERGSIIFQSCGREWRLLRPADLESLWDAIADDAFAEDERLPYWVELWPSTLALARLLMQNKAGIAGKVCLDIGCGLGFTALLASSLGARVIGMDYEPEALVYASKNAAINNVPQPLWAVMDWRFPAIAKGSCDFIWGGDIMYEKRFVRPVFDFLKHCLAPQGRVWFAEPGRGPYEHFSALLAQSGWISRRISRNKVESLHLQSVPVTANLWELRRIWRGATGTCRSRFPNRFIRAIPAGRKIRDFQRGSPLLAAGGTFKIPSFQHCPASFGRRRQFCFRAIPTVIFSTCRPADRRRQPL